MPALAMEDLSLPLQGTLSLRDLHQGLGKKTIGFFAGVFLLVNNITGPGVPLLPNVFIEAGWLSPVCVILAVWLMTSFSSAMYCEAMRRIPGNQHFSDRVEYTNVVRFYFGRKWFIASQIILCCRLQVANVIAIIMSTQVLDNFVSAIFGQSCALNLTPFGNLWFDPHASHLITVPGSRDIFSCVNTKDLNAGNPWGCHVVISFGFILTTAMALPSSRWNLDENVVIQTVAFIITAICWSLWIVVCIMIVLSKVPPVPVVNTNEVTGSQAAVVGNVLFNFGFIATVPSWVNEKAPPVSINKSLWSATLLSAFVFLGIGLFGAWAFEDVLQGQVSGTCRRQQQLQSFDCQNSLLSAFLAEPAPAFLKANPAIHGLVQLSVYIYPIFSIIASIPVFSIVIKYNMLETGSSRGSAFAFAVIFPWLIAFPLLEMPNAMSQVINFSSLFFVTFTDFIVPLALYASLQRADRRGRDVLHLAADAAPIQAGTKWHYAIPHSLGLDSGCKGRFAVVIALTLTTGSIIATVLSLQGVSSAFHFDEETCALVPR